MLTANEQASGVLDEIGSRDHSVTSEYRVFGPPGTGKTTTLSKQIHRAVERFGPDSVLITSFSRAAAAELAGRDLPVEEERIGTLHSHCYRALGSPEIAEANVDEWNRQNPPLHITPVRKYGKLAGEDCVDDDGESEKDGNQWLQDLNRYRGMLIPREAWSPALREFEAKWQTYKDGIALLDFTDLIDRCYHDVRVAPGIPSVIFADEAQDLNPMQLRLIRRWGQHANYFVVAGDDDQTIYGFTGATPDALISSEIPSDHKTILRQSFRVPRAVHAVANKLIHEVQHRQEKHYIPRDAEGIITEVNGTWSAPEYGVLRVVSDALEKNKTVMLLTACSYMLVAVTQILRKSAIPFHNSYRRSNGFWNPLRPTNRASMTNRVLALLVAHPSFGDGQRAWTAADLSLWTDPMTSQGVLKHGAKTQIAKWDSAREITIADLDSVFEPGALESLLTAFGRDHKALLSWLRSRVHGVFGQRIQYPLDIAVQRGPRALLETPRVTVGTIHSVKGGEADLVILFPDLSRAGYSAYQRYGASRDAVIRMFYVGMTRAREALYIANRASMSAARLIV